MLKDGRTLFWLPIFSAENFPGIPRQLLYYSEQSSDRFCWIIKRIDDLLGIPDGITGWLLPEGDTDTDVVVGLWEGILSFCKVVDRRNGEPQTLQSARTPEPDPAEADRRERARVMTWLLPGTAPSYNSLNTRSSR